MKSPLKAKRNSWSIAEEKDFLLLCKEKAIADLPDKCVTSAVAGRPFNFKLLQFYLPIKLLSSYYKLTLKKKVSSVHSHENELRTEIRREPFIRAVFSVFSS